MRGTGPSARTGIGSIEMTGRAGSSLSDAARGIDSVPSSGRSTPTGQRKEDDALLDVDESVVFVEGEDK